MFLFCFPIWKKKNPVSSEKRKTNWALMLTNTIKFWEVLALWLHFSRWPMIASKCDKKFRLDFWCGRPDHALSHHPKNIITRIKNKTNHVHHFVTRLLFSLSPCYAKKKFPSRLWQEKTPSWLYYHVVLTQCAPSQHDWAERLVWEHLEAARNNPGLWRAMR